MKNGRLKTDSEQRKTRETETKEKRDSDQKDERQIDTKKKTDTEKTKMAYIMSITGENQKQIKKLDSIVVTIVGRRAGLTNRGYIV